MMQRVPVVAEEIRETDKAMTGAHFFSNADALEVIPFPSFAPVQGIKNRRSSGSLHIHNLETRQPDCFTNFLFRHLDRIVFHGHVWAANHDASHATQFIES